MRGKVIMLVAGMATLSRRQAPSICTSCTRCPLGKRPIHIPWPVLCSVTNGVRGRAGNVSVRQSPVRLTWLVWVWVWLLLQVPLAVMERLERVPAQHLKQLAADTEVFKILPPGVQRQVWDVGAAEPIRLVLKSAHAL